MSWDDNDEYQVDPDAPPTVEGRVAQAEGELTKLLRAAVGAAAIMGGLIAALDLWRGTGFDNTVGYLVGAAVAMFNLRLLAGGFFAAMRGSTMSARAVVLFLFSFLVLVVLGGFIVVAKREWTLGFAIGLTTPALAGILYGRTLPR